MGVLLIVATDAGSIPKPELNPRRKADEVERSFRVPISPKKLLDRPPPNGIAAGFSIQFARVRSSPQRFDSVLSIVVWCGVPPHHQYTAPNPYRLGFFICGLRTPPAQTHSARSPETVHDQYNVVFAIQ